MTNESDIIKNDPNATIVPTAPVDLKERALWAFRRALEAIKAGEHARHWRGQAERAVDRGDFREAATDVHRAARAADLAVALVGAALDAGYVGPGLYQVAIQATTHVRLASALLATSDDDR